MSRTTIDKPAAPSVDVPGRTTGPITQAWSLADAFRRFAHRVSNVVGSPAAFITAAAVVVVWAACGPFMSYSETWQLVINTATTIATFLMVFLIQNTQNRDARAIHLKLDELIRGVKGARNDVIDLEERSDEELLKLQEEFKQLHERAARARTLRHAKKREGNETHRSA
jgi:low affinity Fe/Cu permease